MKETFQILCATMNQNGFSLIDKMNIKSNVLFANQCNQTYYIEKKEKNLQFEMISTTTRGAGANRNLLLAYATNDICLLSDDDVIYDSDYVDKIMNAFSRHADADMILFNVKRINGGKRKNTYINKEKIMHVWDRNPFGSVNVAFRLNSQRKFNIWFSNILGAGSIYKSGEDTLFINDFRRNGRVYLCPTYIGKVDMSFSSWFDGYNRKYFFNQGAKIAALHKKNILLWILYYGIRIPSDNLHFIARMKEMYKGYKDFGTRR